MNQVLKPFHCLRVLLGLAGLARRRNRLLVRIVFATVPLDRIGRFDPAFGRQVLEKYLKIEDAEVLQEVYQAYLPKRVPLL